MELTQEPYAQIAGGLPKQRGNVQHENLQVLNARLYVAGQGCKWRGLPAHFGKWHAVYTRMTRWSKNGVIQRVFAELQRAQIVGIKVEAVALERTIIKVHPAGTGALKKTGRKPAGSAAPAGAPRFIWWPRMLLARSPSPCRPGGMGLVPEGGNFCGPGKSRAPSVLSSWTAPMKGMKPGHWPWTLG